MSINSFPDYKYLLQENYVEYKHIFFKCKSHQEVFLQHISTLQHALLLLHGECLIDNQFLSGNEFMLILYNEIVPKVYATLYTPPPYAQM